MTTELAIRVIETKPAVVNFNYQEIANHLDSVLDKYKGLVFTESTVSECKKTIADLRKGQKSLDEFRKTTKKQLTESVTDFENQCKTLHGKFEDVIKPLTLQKDKFELNRREKKRIEIQGIIDALSFDLNLTGKYASQLTIPEEYYNKGKSIKAIKNELTTLANTLKVQQDKEEQDINIIKTKVELANAQYYLTVKLMPDPYLRLLSFKSAAEIELMITSDAEQMITSDAEQMMTTETEKIEVSKTVPVKKPTFVPVMDTVPVSVPVTGKNITAVYEITGTEEQLSALEAYLDANYLSWADRPNE